MCRDQNMVHAWLAKQNIGFKTVLEEVGEDGQPVAKVWSWPLGEE